MHRFMKSFQQCWLWDFQPYTQFPPKCHHFPQIFTKHFHINVHYYLNFSFFNLQLSEWRKSIHAGWLMSPRFSSLSPSFLPFLSSLSFILSFSISYSSLPLFFTSILIFLESFKNIRRFSKIILFCSGRKEGGKEKQGWGNNVFSFPLHPSFSLFPSYFFNNLSVFTPSLLRIFLQYISFFKS